MENVEFSYGDAEIESFVDELVGHLTHLCKLVVRRLALADERNKARHDRGLAEPVEFKYGD